VLMITQMEMLQGFRHGGEAIVKAKGNLMDVLSAYVSAAQESGVIRAEVDASYVVWTLMDRIFNQAVYAASLSRMYDVSISDPNYRTEWVQKTVDLLINGVR
jgi:hypothetical protein